MKDTIGINQQVEIGKNDILEIDIAQHDTSFSLNLVISFFSLVIQKF